MPKTRISEYSATNSSNTDIEGINIDEGCPPSSINNAIRELMVHLKEFQTGASGDAFTFAGGTLMSGTNTISGAAVISGNINSSGTTNTFSGGNIFSGTNTFSGTNVFSSNVTLNAQSDLRFADSDSSNWVAFQAPATVSSNVTWTLPAADGTSNQALVTNGSGTLSFATAGSSLTGVTDSASPYETSLGTGAGGSSTGVNNTFIGFEAGNDNTTGTNNTAVGYQALDVNTTGSNNVAVGLDALGANTTGLENVAIGVYALNANTTASGNVAIGYASLYTNTTGAENTAVGRDSLYSNTTGIRNVAVGRRALNSNTTASNNTAIGYEALQANTTGYNNTAVGYQAGSGITTGATNLTIGVNCTTELTTGNDNTCVNALNGGNRLFALTTESNRILIGYNGVTNAYVQVAWTVVSDSRDKTDVVDAPYGLSFVQELRPVQYRWDRRSKYENNQPDGTHKEDKKQLGFLAQDVIALEKKYGGVAKDLLIGDDEHDETLKITETKIIPILVKAIQELSAKVAALEAQLATPPATSPAEPNA